MVAVWVALCLPCALKLYRLTHLHEDEVRPAARRTPGSARGPPGRIADRPLAPRRHSAQRDLRSSRPPSSSARVAAGQPAGSHPPLGAVYVRQLPSRSLDLHWLHKSLLGPVVVVFAMLDGYCEQFLHQCQLSDRGAWTYVAMSALSFLGDRKAPQQGRRLALLVARPQPANENRGHTYASATVLVQ